MRSYFLVLAVFLFVLILGGACSPPEYRASKKIAFLCFKFPELCSSKSKSDTIVHIDTIKYVTDGAIIDTTVTTMFDTITVGNERIITKIRIKRGIVDTFHIRTIVNPDSIQIVVRDTLIRTETERTFTKIEKRNPWWVKLVLWVLVLGLVGAIGYGWFRSYKRKAQIE